VNESEALIGKHYPNVHGQTRGAVALSLPLNTPLYAVVLWQAPRSRVRKPRVRVIESWHENEFARHVGDAGITGELNDTRNDHC